MNPLNTSPSGPWDSQSESPYMAMSDGTSSGIQRSAGPHPFATRYDGEKAWVFFGCVFILWNWSEQIATTDSVWYLPSSDPLADFVEYVFPTHTESDHAIGPRINHIEFGLPMQFNEHNAAKGQILYLNIEHSHNSVTGKPSVEAASTLPKCTDSLLAIPVAEISASGIVTQHLTVTPFIHLCSQTTQ